MIGPQAGTGEGLRLDASGNAKVNGTLTVTGITTLSQIGTNTVLTIKAANYLANAVQTALGLSSTPVFTETLPSLQL